MNNLLIIYETYTNGYKTDILNVISLLAILCGKFVGFISTTFSVTSSRFYVLDRDIFNNNIFFFILYIGSLLFNRYIILFLPVFNIFISLVINSNILYELFINLL